MKPESVSAGDLRRNPLRTGRKLSPTSAAAPPSCHPNPNSFAMAHPVTGPEVPRERRTETTSSLFSPGYPRAFDFRPNCHVTVSSIVSPSYALMNRQHGLLHVGVGVMTHDVLKSQ